MPYVKLPPVNIQGSKDNKKNKKIPSSKQWNPLKCLTPPPPRVCCTGGEGSDFSGEEEQGGQKDDKENGRFLGGAEGEVIPSTPCGGNQSKLRKEINQCRKDLVSYFMKLRKELSEDKGPVESISPLREVPIGGDRIGFVSAPLTSTEVRQFKKEMKSLIEDPIGLAEQLDQFLGPSLYSLAEISIMNILFSGEERGMIRQAAMQAWERTNAPGNQVVTAEQKFPNADPGWDNNNQEH